MVTAKTLWLNHALCAAALCAVLGWAAKARADSIPSPGCTAEAFMDTSSGLDTDSIWGLTYADVEIDQPGLHEFRARALAASEFGVNPAPETRTYILGSAPGAEIYSDSFASGINVLAWIPMSDTVPAGTPIVARYSVDLQGTIYSWGNNIRSAKTSVDLILTAYGPAAGPLAHLGGTASIEMYSAPGYPVEFIETGDLIGLFNWDGEHDPSADVDAQLTLTFDAEIGTTYIIEVILTSVLHAGALPESTAFSDFYDSCTYQFAGAFDPADVNFTSPLDVYMTTIPEPATLSLLSVGGLLLIWRYRKMGEENQCDG